MIMVMVMIMVEWIDDDSGNDDGGYVDDGDYDGGDDVDGGDCDGNVVDNSLISFPGNIHSQEIHADIQRTILLTCKKTDLPTIQNTTSTFKVNNSTG